MKETRKYLRSWIFIDFFFKKKLFKTSIDCRFIFRPSQLYFRVNPFTALGLRSDSNVLINTPLYPVIAAEIPVSINSRSSVELPSFETASLHTEKISVRLKVRPSPSLIVSWRF